MQPGYRGADGDARARCAIQGPAISLLPSRTTMAPVRGGVLEFLHLTGRPADGELLDSRRRTEPKMDEARQDHVHMAVVVEIRERHRADAFEFGGNAGTGGGVFRFPAAERKIKSRAGNIGDEDVAFAVLVHIRRENTALLNGAFVGGSFPVVVESPVVEAALTPDFAHDRDAGGGDMVFYKPGFLYPPRLSGDAIGAGNGIPFQFQFGENFARLAVGPLAGQPHRAAGRPWSVECLLAPRHQLVRAIFTSVAVAAVIFRPSSPFSPAQGLLDAIKAAR